MFDSIFPNVDNDQNNKKDLKYLLSLLHKAISMYLFILP